jgi:two-component system, LytTR family, response regulator
VRPSPRRFLARRGGKFRVVPEEAVIYLATEDGLTRLHTEGESFVLELSLAELEVRLDPRQFYRVSRAAIVRLGTVREIVTLTGGYGEALLQGGTRLAVSRRRFPGLLDRIASS